MERDNVERADLRAKAELAKLEAETAWLKVKTDCVTLVYVLAVSAMIVGAVYSAGRLFGWWS